ncbi:hypothetical protein M9458_045850, partial [Cirrhinus mrigala]
MPCDTSAINDFFRTGRFPSLRVRSDDCNEQEPSQLCDILWMTVNAVDHVESRHTAALGRNLTSCHNHVVRTVIQNGCEAWRHCGNEVSALLPFKR